MKNADGKELWFAAKTYGYGWTPVTWQGWLLVLLYLAVFTWILWRDSADGVVQVQTLVIVTILTGLLIWVSAVKGEKPGWRWGKK